MTATEAPIQRGKYVIVPNDQDPAKGASLRRIFERHHTVVVVSGPSDVTGSITVDCEPDDAASIQSMQITAAGAGAFVMANNKLD